MLVLPLSKSPTYTSMEMLNILKVFYRWYGILEFNVPLDTLVVILETGKCTE